MHVLFAPAHYTLSDRIGSEPYIASRIVTEVLKRDRRLKATVICGYYLPSNNLDAVIKGALSNRINVISLYKGKPKFSDTHKLKFYMNLYLYIKINGLTRKADIVHHVLPFGYKTTFNLVYRLARKHKRPFIVGPLQSPQLFVGRDEFVGQRFSERKPILYNVELLRRISAPALFKLFKDTIKEARVLIVATRFAKRLYEKYVNEDKVIVIPFGIDVKEIKVKDYNRSQDKVSIMYAGALTYRKGVYYLLRAFAGITKQNKNVELHIYGSGPQEHYLKALASSLGISHRVYFHGLISREELLKEYSRHDIYVHPSLSESFGLAILEAMAAGLPVIAFNIPNVNEIVEHGRVGLLAKRGDSTDLSKKLTLLTDDEKLRKTLGLSAREKTREVYDWNIVSQKYISVYRSLVG